MPLRSIALSLFLFASAIKATPPISREPVPEVIKLGDGNGTRSLGAAYFMTNEPDANYVVASDILSNGTMALRSAFFTGGKGGHGQQAVLGPDALFSLGSVRSHMSSPTKFLAIMNAGSNTVTLFKIDPNDPSTLEKIGQPVDSKGDFPVSLAYNSNATMACVLNSGKRNGVQCYSVDGEAGLTPLADTNRRLNLNQTTPPSGPKGTPSHILFTGDDHQLVVSVKGVPPTPGMVAIWNITENRSLSKTFQAVKPPSGGLMPFSMTRLPSTNAILATDSAVGFELYEIDNKIGRGVGSAIEIPGQISTGWSTISSQIGNFYLVDIGAARITEVNVTDQLVSSIIAEHNLTPGSAPMDVTVAAINGQDKLYVIAANATSVDVLSLEGPGEARIIQQLNFSGPAKLAGLKVDPNNIQGMSVFTKT